MIHDVAITSTRARRQKIRLVATLIFSLLLASCSTHERSALPEYKPDQDQFLGAKAPTLDYQDPGKWWLSLGLAELDPVLEASFQNNPALKISRARLEQRISMETQNFALLFPELGAELSSSSSSSQASGKSVTSTSNSLSLKLSYEVDLFSKNSSRYSAAQLDLLAAIEDYKAQVSKHATNLVTLWLNVAQGKANLRLTEERMVFDQANTELVTNSYRLGSATLADVLQAKEQELTTKIQISQLKNKLFTDTQSLLVILGSNPTKEESFPMDLSQITPRPTATGLPSELIQRRPDLRSALINIKAQDERIGQAVADRYPRLTLSASTGTSSDSFSGLTDTGNLFSNLAAGLTLPILDWGRRKAEVNRQKALLKEKVAFYQQTLLSAVQEVQSLISKSEMNEEAVRLYQSQIEISKERLDLTKQGFIQGVNLWSQVLASQNQVFTAQKNLLGSKRDWLQSHIELYGSLGGTWMDKHFESVQSQLNPEMAP